MDKKIKILAALISVYIVLCIVRLIIPDKLLNEVKNTINYEVEKAIISMVSSSNIKMIDYYMMDNSIENPNIIYEVIGKTTSYLEYVRNENNNITVNVYDPNISLSVSGNQGVNNNDVINDDEESTEDNMSANEQTTNKDNLNEGSTEHNDTSNETSTEGTENKQEVSTQGIVYSMAQLSDFNFLMNNMYIVTERANLYKSDLVAQELLDVDLRIEKNSKSPQILIYHTHSHEGFVDTTGVNTSNIVAVGAYLAEVLSTKYGYNVIHCTESFDEVNGVFDRSKAYTYATPAIEKILENNPTIEVVLDIHRDGLPDDSPKLVTTINGKQTAKVMFFNGISRNDKGEISYLRNPNRHENLAMSFQMKLKALEMYPEFTRKNYIDAYMYNLHLRKRSMLLEVGAQNNTFEEAKNAMEPFAAILNEILQ